MTQAMLFTTNGSWTELGTDPLAAASVPGGDWDEERKRAGYLNWGN